jgi:hypothetical protein
MEIKLLRMRYAWFTPLLPHKFGARVAVDHGFGELVSGERRNHDTSPRKREAVKENLKDEREKNWGISWD